MARNIFIRKFRRKTKKELQYIIDNAIGYAPEAVEAARELLGEDDFDEESDSPDSTKTRKRRKPVRRFKESSQALYFLQHYKWADFWTMLSLATFWLACLNIINYYSGEPYFEEVSVYWFQVPLLLVFPLVGHFFYRHDHGLSNNFLGRSIASVFMFAAFIILDTVYDSLVAGSYNGIIEDFGQGLMVFVVMVIIVLCYELGVFVFREMIRALGWDVL